MTKTTELTDVIFFSKENYVLASRIRKTVKKLNYEVNYCNNLCDLIGRIICNRNCVIFLDKDYNRFAHFLSQLVISKLDIIENVRFIFIDDNLSDYLKYVNNKNLFTIPETNLEVALPNIMTSCEMLNCKNNSIANSKINYNQLISDILLSLGFSYKLLGFRYIKLCLEHAIRNNFTLGSLSKEVYSYVAMQNCTSINNIERGIRTAIEDASKTESFQKENISKNTNKKVSNKMFLEYMLDKIIIYKNKQN